MKPISFLFLFAILFLSCQSKENSVSEKEEPKTSRILNQELKNILPELIQLQNQIFDKETTNGNYDPKHLYARILTAENFFYLNLTFNDCGFNGFYPFQEKMGNHKIDFFVDSKSFQPERYFDLRNLTQIQDSDVEICEDWYFLKAKFQLINGKLKLTKISTFFDNSYSEKSFYDKQDSAFLHKIEVLMVEPEPIQKKEN